MADLRAAMLPDGTHVGGCKGAERRGSPEWARSCPAYAVHVGVQLLGPRSDRLLKTAVLGFRAAIARGERPLFVVKWQWDGVSAELEFLDLPGVWTIAPGIRYLAAAARKRIALELEVPESEFDVEIVGTRGDMPQDSQRAATYVSRGPVL